MNCQPWLIAQAVVAGGGGHGCSRALLSPPKQRCRLSDTSISIQLDAQIIMDGNARWARRRALPVSAGHAQGVEALRRVVAACLEWGIPALTVRRPRQRPPARPRAAARGAAARGAAAAPLASPRAAGEHRRTGRGRTGSRPAARARPRRAGVWPVGGQPAPARRAGAGGAAHTGGGGTRARAGGPAQPRRAPALPGRARAAARVRPRGGGAVRRARAPAWRAVPRAPISPATVERGAREATGCRLARRGRVTLAPARARNKA